MKRHNIRFAAIWLILTVFLSSGCAANANKSSDSIDANNQVKALATEIFRNDLINSPINATMIVGDLSAYGLQDLASELDDMSLSGISKYYDSINAYVDKANKINPDLLTPGNRTLLKRIKYNLKLTMEDGKYILDQDPVNQSMGAQIAIPIALTQMPLSSEQDIKDYLSRIGQFDRLMGELADFEREKIKNKTLMPSVIYDKVIQQCNDLIAVQPDKSIFYLYLEDELKGIPSISTDAAASYLSECLATITDKITPSYKALINAMEDAKKATTITGGLWQFPDGKDYYKFLVKNETGDNITPEELHDWAQTEFSNGIASLNSLMNKLNEKGLSLDDAFNLNPEYTKFSQLYDILNGIVKDNFEPYAIPPVTEKIIPSYLEADMPAGFYLSLTIDGLKLGDMFLKQSSYNEVNFDSLILLGHEDIPGHHLQQSVLIGLPLTPYEKAGSEMAYIEGWASYCETLVSESVQKDQPLYGEVLKVNFDLSYSMSVLMDYDLHYGGMTCQEVIDKYKAFMGEDTEKVVYRTLVSPGESIHYAYGRYIILKLRDEAQKALGNQFDIKAFHDTVLKVGPCSMTDLKNSVHGYIVTALLQQHKFGLLMPFAQSAVKSIP